MINIDVKRPENANMEIWEILFFTFYSWKNAKFLVKIKKCLPNMIKIDAKRPENANMEIWEILFFTFYSWKNAKFLVKIPNMINIDAKRLEMQIWKFEKFYFSHFTLEKTPNSW